MSDPLDDVRKSISQMVHELARSSQSSYVLVAYGALEYSLQMTILMKMRHDLSNTMKERLFEGYGPISSGTAKIDIAYALSIMSAAERADFHLVRDIRNKFAHPIDQMNFDHATIDKLLRNLPKSRRGATNLETFVTLITGCFTCLAVELDRAGLNTPLSRYLSSPPTSP